MCGSDEMWMRTGAIIEAMESCTEQVFLSTPRDGSDSWKASASRGADTFTANGDSPLEAALRLRGLVPRR